MRIDAFPVVRRRIGSLAWRTCALLAIIANSPLRAQTATCDTGNGANSACPGAQVTISLAVPRAAQLTLSASTLSLINNSLAAEDYEAGSKTNGSLTATAWADTGAVVTMAAATTNFTAPAGVTKAASTLQASVDGGSTWNGLTTSGATIITIPAGGSSGTAKTIQFRTLLGYTTDPPGTYSLQINFTVTAP